MQASCCAVNASFVAEETSCLLQNATRGGLQVLAKRPGNQWPAKKFMTIKQIKAANRTDMQQ